LFSVTKSLLSSGFLASFGNFAFRNVSKAIVASDSEKPRINARFWGLVLLRGKGLLVLDRAFLRGFWRQLGRDPPTSAMRIYEQLKMDCIVSLFTALSAKPLSTGSLAYRFEAEGSKKGDKALESVF
jgi:hypothetical protein